MRFRFLKTILVLVITIALALIYPMSVLASTEIVRAVVASGIIAFTNLILGYLSLEFAIERSNTIFMLMVFGGMGARVGFILLAVALLVVNGYHAGGLVLSLMAFYVVSMIAELTYVMRDLGHRSEMAQQAARQARRDASKPLSLRTVSL